MFIQDNPDFFIVWYSFVVITSWCKTSYFVSFFYSFSLFYHWNRLVIALKYLFSQFLLLDSIRQIVPKREQKRRQRALKILDLFTLTPTFFLLLRLCKLVPFLDKCINTVHVLAGYCLMTPVSLALNLSNVLTAPNDTARWVVVVVRYADMQAFFAWQLWQQEAGFFGSGQDWEFRRVILVQCPLSDVPHIHEHPVVSLKPKNSVLLQRETLESTGDPCSIFGLLKTLDSQCCTSLVEAATEPWHCA